MSTRRDHVGSLVGLAILMAGLAMIALAFYLAYQLFHEPPSVALHIVPGQTMDFGQTVASLLQIGVKVVMLVLMTVFGSVFANRGIKLYEAGRPRATRKRTEKEKSDQLDDNK